ncbi:hypothetical protein K2173_012602 [Erythroxylum novogranatense]|uniref:AB hydrolase-1 domain-containing protein n=1 Tax=Erythroxylum novogranatense TaxID=1862640 RepID=A0AAV8S7J5_9ROSI|nr:hypothetical protein K2173_012602 [Erythroxylum novogranatense]
MSTSQQLAFQSLTLFNFTDCSRHRRYFVNFPADPYADSYPKLLPPRADASSAGVYPPYSDEWKAKTNEKRKRIAGIDQVELLHPELLADPDSRFCDFNGVRIHYKVCDAAESQSHDSELPAASFAKLDFPFILLHGFGASVFSWSRAMKPLAQLTASKVVAFDRPAFGLTSRDFSFANSSPTPDDGSRSLNPYSIAFSTLATLYFVDLLKARTAILVGHSAGSLVAVNSYFEAPERVAALILVSPAIFAPLLVDNSVEGFYSGRSKKIEGEASYSKALANLSRPIFEILSKIITFVFQKTLQMVKGVINVLNLLFKKALSAIIRSAIGVLLIRMAIDKFGLAAIRNAWFDPNQVTERTITGYTKPLRVRGWDKALAEFTAATLANVDALSKSPLSKRLREISCPVLIVTGDTDRIVPSWNARRLAQALPSSHLEVIKDCGHLPHEEKVEEFVSVVEEFLQRAFGG